MASIREPPARAIRGHRQGAAAPPNQRHPEPTRTGHWARELDRVFNFDLIQYFGLSLIFKVIFSHRLIDAWRGDCIGF
jgi:hypothetical protein